MSYPASVTRVTRDATSADLEAVFDAVKVIREPLFLMAESLSDVVSKGYVVVENELLGLGLGRTLVDPLCRIFGIDREPFTRFAKRTGREWDTSSHLHPVQAACLMIYAEALGVPMNPEHVSAFLEAARGILPDDRGESFADETLLARYDGTPVALRIIATDAGTPTGNYDGVWTEGTRRLCLWRDADGKATMLTAPPVFGVPSAATATPGRRCGLVLQARRQAGTRKRDWVPAREKARSAMGAA